MYVKCKVNISAGLPKCLQYCHFGLPLVCKEAKSFKKQTILNFWLGLPGQVWVLEALCLRINSFCLQQVIEVVWWLLVCSRSTVSLMMEVKLDNTGAYFGGDTSIALIK